MSKNNLGISNLEPGFVYNVRVRGIFNGLAGNWSATQSIDVFSDTSSGTGDKAPAAVSGFSVAATIDSFILTWTAPTLNADGTTLSDMKDYVIEVRSAGYSGSASAVYYITEHQKPSDLAAIERNRTFEFTYKMNKDLFGGSGNAGPYFTVYARDTTNNRSAAAQDRVVNASPSAPTSLTADAVVGGVNLAWGGGTSNDIVAYTLKYSSSTGFDPNSAGTEIYRGNLTQFSFGGTAGTTYYFRVGSVDTFGQISWYSTEASATPLAGGASADTTPPDPPGTISDEWLNDTYRLSWVASTSDDTVKYQIDMTSNSVTKTFYVTDSQLDITVPVGRTFGSSWPYSVTNVDVYAIDGAGNISTASTKSSGFTTAPATPSAPTLTASIVSGGISVTWTPPTDTSGIIQAVEIYGGTATSPTSLYYTGSNVNDEFLLPLSPTYSGTYYFRSKVLDIFGRYSAYSAQAQVTVTTVGNPTTGARTTAIDTSDPKGLTAIITLNWTNPTTATFAGTKIRYKPDALSDWTEVDTGVSTTYTIRGLPTGVLYNLAVISYDFRGITGGGGWQAFTDLTTATDSTAPSQPSAPNVAANTMQIQVSQDFTKNAGGALEADVKEFEVYVDNTTSPTTKIGTIPYSGSGITSVASFNVPASASSGTAEVWYARTKAVDWSGNASSYSPTSNDSVTLIAAENIQDATITNAKIHDLDAGKIDAGFIDAARIDAGTITASKLSVTVGGGNVLFNSSFETWDTGTPTSWSNTANTTTTQVTGHNGGGSAARFTSTTAANDGSSRLNQTGLSTEVTPSSNYVLSAWVRRISGTGDLKVGIDAVGVYTIAGSATSPAISSSWQRFSVPFNSGSFSGTIGIHLSVADDIFEIDEMQLELGDVATSYSPRADEILPGTITASQIQALTITGDQIQGNSIDGDKITAGTISGDRLEAGVITSGSGNMVPPEYASFELKDYSTLFPTVTGCVPGVDRTFNVGMADITSTTATLWIGPHGFITGQQVTVSGVSVDGTGATFNGTFTLTGADQTGTISYTTTSSQNGSSQISNGTVTPTGSPSPIDSQSTLRVRWTTGVGATLYLGTSSTDYNITSKASDQNYMFSAWVYQNSGSARTIQLGVKRSSDGSVRPSSLETLNVPDSTWTRVYTTFTIGDSSPLFLAFISGYSATETFWVDAIQMEETPGDGLPSTYRSPSFTRIAGGQILTGSIQSGSYVQGETGWAINNDGTVEFQDAVMRGNISADEGAIGGWQITDGRLASQSGDSGRAKIELDAGIDGNLLVAGLPVAGVAIGDDTPTSLTDGQLWIDTSEAGQWGEQIYANEKASKSVSWTAISGSTGSVYKLAEFTFDTQYQSVSLSGRVFMYSTSSASSSYQPYWIDFEMFAKQQSAIGNSPVCNMMTSNFTSGTMSIDIRTSTNTVAIWVTGVQSNCRAGLSLNTFESGTDVYSWYNGATAGTITGTTVDAYQGSIYMPQSSASKDVGDAPKYKIYNPYTSSVSTVGFTPHVMFKTWFDHDTDITLQNSYYTCPVGHWNTSDGYNYINTGGWTVGSNFNSTTSADSGKIWFPYSGVYEVKAYALINSYSPTAGTGNRALRLLACINDGITTTPTALVDYIATATDPRSTAYLELDRMLQQNLANDTMGGTDYIAVNAGDYMRLWIYNFSGATASIRTANNAPSDYNLSIRYLGGRA